MNKFSYNLLYRFQQIYNKMLSYFINYNYSSKKNPSISLKTIIEYNKTRSKGPKKIICYAPFKHMYFGSDGVVSACCANKTETYGKYENKSLDDLWKSDSINLLRNDIKNFNLSKGCYYCNQQLQSKNYKNFIGKIYDSIFPFTNKKFPTEMTFEISNICNLECVMCDGTFSSSIRKNRENLPPLKDKYGPEFFNQIKPAIKHLNVANFQGGEPFLIPQYYEIIEYIIKHNQKCKIYIQTNGTVLNERVKKIIEHKNVHLSISIDSLKKETYETIRKNASFSRLTEHLEYFKIRSKDFNQFININYCVMTHNWMEVPAMISFCNENNFSLTLIHVESPKEQSLQFLDEMNLKKIIEYYEQDSFNDLKNEHKFNGEKFIDLINSLKYFHNNLLQQRKRKEQLLQFNLDQIKDSILAYFNDSIFKDVNLKPVYNLLNEETQMNNTDEYKDKLSGFLADLENNYLNLKSDYINNKHWPPDFERYFFEKQLS